MTNFAFLCRAVSNSSDTTASIGNFSSTGKAQEYQVSLYISKKNQFVRNIRA